MAKLIFKTPPTKTEKPDVANLEVENWPMERVKPYSKNAKNHPPEQVKILVKLIEKHGFDQPIVVDTTGTIIKGHGRWLAMKALGKQTIPVIVSKLSPEDARAARIADNRSAEFGWNFDALIADVVGGLSRGIDINHTGFTLKELGLDNAQNVDDITEKLAVETHTFEDEDDDTPRPRASSTDDKEGEQHAGAVVPNADEETIKCPRCSHPVTAAD